MNTYEVRIMRHTPWTWEWEAIEHQHLTGTTHYLTLNHGRAHTAHTARRAATRAVKARKKALRDDIWSNE